MEQHLSVWDLILTPIYWIIILSISLKSRNKLYPPGHALRNIYIQALNIKLVGAVLIALIFQYYYKGRGDTYNFFADSQIINSALWNDSLSTWIKLIYRAPLEDNPEMYNYVSQLRWYEDTPSYMVVRVCSVVGLFNGTSYIPIAMVFAYLSFTGVWAMYRTFVSLYPTLYKKLAIAFIFIPSSVLWGSAVFKDTICLFGLGWLTYTTFRIFIHRDFSSKNLVLFALSFYLIYVIKIYILLSFIPALAIWLLTSYSSKIKVVPVRFLVRFSFVGIAIVSFLFIARAFSEELNKYSLDSIAQTASVTRNWISYVSETQDGSSYDLGEFDPSIGGMLQKFPQAVIVTFFRPFPWEARKVFVILSALEALAFTYFTIQAFRRRGVIKGLKMINADPNLFFCLVFSFIFAFAVGISSYNFGALSRYKIPCLPFFATVLVVLLYKDETLKFKDPRSRVVKSPQAIPM